MNRFYYALFFFVPFLFLVSTQTAAQTNKNVNYQVIWKDYTIETDDNKCTGPNANTRDGHDVCCCIGESDEWRTQLSVRENSTGSFYSTLKENNGINTTYTVYYPDQTVRNEEDVAVSHINFIQSAWEDDNGNTTYTSADDHYGSHSQNVYFTNFSPRVSPCTQHEQNFLHTGNNDHQGKTYTAWRYHNGEDFSEPLTFGEILQGNTVANVNKAASAPSGFNSRLGYGNDFDNGNVAGSGLSSRPDVCYTFNVNNACRRYTIRNKMAGSDVDFWLGSVVNAGTPSATFTFIAKIENTSSGDEFFLHPGTYGVIAESPTNNNLDFELWITRSEVPAMTAGAIQLNGPYAVPVDAAHAISLGNLSSATNYMSYQWQRQVKGGSWPASSDIAGATDAFYFPPTFTVANTYEFRRCAINGCGQKVYSNVIEIQALASNGNVEGHVYTPSQPPSGVQDITVTLTNLENIVGGPAANSLSLTATTNNQGKFDIQQFYVGPNMTDWRLTPSYPGHGFDPADITVTLGNADPDETGLVFTDTSSFSFSGKVKHDFNGQSCGLAGASIKLNGVFKTYTDINGDYNISIPQIGSHTVSVSYADHTFANSSITIFVDEDKSGQDFIDNTYRTLNLSLLAGCNSYAGTANIQLLDSSNCLNINDVTSGSGNLNLLVPAKPYQINVTGFNQIMSPPLNKYSSGYVVAYFDAIEIRVDLSVADSTLDLIYHPEPTVEVLGLPDPPDCGFSTAVVDQFSQIPLQINLWDHLPGEITSVGCKLDTGSILINDYVGSPDDDPVVNTYQINSAGLNYLLVPGSPSLAPPHTKAFEVIGSDLFNRSDYATSNMLIEGFRARASTFTTVSPEVPLFILRDPPGDLSFSQIIENSVVEKTYSMHSSVGGSFKAWAKAIMDVAGPDGSNSKGWGEIGGSIEIGRDNVTATEALSTMSFTQSFSTSADQDPKSIFEEGDVYVGGAFNIIYGVNDIIQFDHNRCEVKRDKKLMISPDTFSTTYVWTHQHIRDVIIPNLRDELAGGLTDPDSIAFFENQAAIWEQTIQRNIDLKKKATYGTNYSFNGGAGAITETSEIGTANTSSFEWTANLDVEVAAELGLVLGGTGAAGGFETHFRLDWGEGESTTTSNSTTTHFELDDDNAADIYSVDVGKDSLYSSPVFRVQAANTACPYLPGTLPRYDAVLTVDQSLHYDIDPNDPVVLRFNIFNQSQSNEDLYYVMSFNNASNPDGALIDGSPNPGLNWSFSDPIPYNDSVQQTVTIERGSSNVYAFEGLEFRVYPSCNEINSDFVSPVASQKISIYYNTPCTDVLISEPGQNWVSSSEIGSVLPIRVTDYIASNMSALSIEYTQKGKSSWSQAINIPIASLHQNPTVGSLYNWNTTNVADGEYDIRAKITCGSDVIHTARISGIIDQNYPIIYGRPKPENHILETSTEEISMRFNENINCMNLNNSNVQLINILTEQKIDVAILCQDNEILVQPNVNLLKLVPAPYRLIVTDLEDNFGNANPDTLSWEFSTDGYDEFTCDESTIFYVDQSAVLGKRNGLTWEDAFVDLRDALEIACPMSSIYIAEGNYHPWDSIQQLDVLGNMIVDPDSIVTDESYFTVTHSYNLYGGFPLGGSDFSQRNPAVYQTVLSGDKNDNQVGDAGDSHTLMGLRTGVESIVDGLIFEYAFADGLHGSNRYGGGVLDYSGSHFVNCIFRGLEAIGFGSNNDGVGGALIHFGTGETTLSGCLFYNNHATNDGGAVSPQGGTLNIINCTFANNISDRRGGAIHNFSSILNISNSIFYNNSAAVSHQDIFAFTPISIAINNCLFDVALPAITHTGANNYINTDPDFMSPTTNDYTLKSTSMAIENGDNAVVPEEVKRDLKDDVRFMDNSYSGNAIVDLGAYEHSPCASAGGANILYVDESVAPGMIGTSWTTAINSLARAIVVATSCNVDTIYVAQGTYMPDESQFPTSREARFIITENMVVIGGFPTGGSTLENRDWNAYPTILSGNLGNVNSISDDAFTVVEISNVGLSVLLDGLIIERGNSFSTGTSHKTRGGGIYIHGSGLNKSSNPVIRNCIIRNNRARNGGGMALVSENAALVAPVIANCILENNESTNGGAVAELSTGLFSLVNGFYVNSLLNNNSSTKHGGGIYALGSTDGQVVSRLTNCTVVDNIADENLSGSGNGGGVAISTYSDGNASHVYENSVFWGNLAGANQQQVSNLASSVSSLASSVMQDEVAGDMVINIPGSMTDAGGNTDLAPTFIDAANNNYRLLYGSVGIDFADDGKNAFTTDLAGSSRNLGLQIDAGAYEFDYNFPCGVYSTLDIVADPIYAGIYRADGLISSTGKVTSLSTGPVSFKSKMEILLSTDFEVKLGEEFEAVIENPCVD